MRKLSHSKITDCFTGKSFFKPGNTFESGRMGATWCLKSKENITLGGAFESNILKKHR